MYSAYQTERGTELLLPANVRYSKQTRLGHMQLLYTDSMQMILELFHPLCIRPIT